MLLLICISIVYLKSADTLRRNFSKEIARTTIIGRQSIDIQDGLYEGLLKLRVCLFNERGRIAFKFI